MSGRRILSAVVALAAIAAVLPLAGGTRPPAAHSQEAGFERRAITPLLARDTSSGEEPPPEERAPTSIDLINDAFGRGDITSDEALTYRFYAVFEDPRLPAAYTGDDSDEHDAPDLWAEYASASSATQALLRPFTLRPDDPESWVQTTEAGFNFDAVATSQAIAAVGDRPTGAWLSTAGSKVRVWYPNWGPGGQTAILADKAEAVVRETEDLIWPKLLGLLGREPPTDCTLFCDGQGGSSHYDIYLTNIARSVTAYNPPCTGISSWILLNPNAKFETLAHELMHGFQNAFPMAGCEEYRWLHEATAQWAIDFVYARTYNAEEQIADRYLEDPTVPLDFRDDRREYGAYVFFFYLTRIGGSPGLIKAIWTAAASNSDSLKAIEDSIPGGFDKHFHEFAKYNWNPPEAVLNKYRQLDELTDRAIPEARTRATSGGSARAYELAADVEYLSSVYYEFTIAPDVSTLAFYNGFNYKLAREDIGDGFIAYTQTELDASLPVRQHGKVQALIKRAGKDWEAADWSNKPAQLFCQDDPADRLERLVLVFSNGDFRGTSPPLEPTGIEPTVWASNVGCWRWKGTATFRSADGIYSIDADVTWRASGTNSGQPGQISGAATGTKYGAIGMNYIPLEGTITWRAQGTDSSGCVHSGSTTFQFLAQNPISNVLTVFNIVPEGTYYRAYVGDGLTPPVSETVDCPGPGAPDVVTFPNLVWLLAGSPTAVPLKVGENGKTISGVFIEVDSGTWRWNFTAQRGP